MLSSYLAALAGDMTSKPETSALAALAEPGRGAVLTSFTPETRMVMTLAAVPDDDDFLLFYDIDVGVPIITNAHINFPFQGARLTASCLHDRDVDRRA